MQRAILFIPGLMQDARVFLPQMVALGTEHSVQVFVPDGDSVERLSERALAAAPAEFVAVGHGLGANIAIDLMRRAPDRVSSMVLLAVDPLAEAPQIAADREARMVAARAGRLKEALLQDVPDAALSDISEKAALRMLLQDMAYGLGEGVYLRQCKAMQRRPDQQKTIRKATVPTLFLAGELDSVVPRRRMEFARDMMPKSALKILNEAGHLPSLEQPEQVSAAIKSFMAGPMILR